MKDSLIFTTFTTHTFLYCFPISLRRVVSHKQSAQVPHCYKLDTTHPLHLRPASLNHKHEHLLLVLELCFHFSNAEHELPSKLEFMEIPNENLNANAGACLNGWKHLADFVTRDPLVCLTQPLKCFQN